jgi:hypothetical protein
MLTYLMISKGRFDSVPTTFDILLDFYSDDPKSIIEM